MRNRLLLLAFAATALATPALATNTFGIQYFTILGTYAGQPGGDPDFNTIGCCTQTFFNEVQSQLVGGLPVLNPNYGGPTIHDVTAAGQITWWSPSLNSNVTATGTGTVTTPFANDSFFPPNGTDGNGAGGGDGPANNFQGAIITGQFDVTASGGEAVTFSFGADDDAFLALDGTIISQEGGIHGISDAPVVTPVLADGLHTFELFYVDRNQTGAGLEFNVVTQDITVTPPSPGVPEPATWAMMLTGFFGLGGVLRSRRRVTATA